MIRLNNLSKDGLARLEAQRQGKLPQQFFILYKNAQNGLFLERKHKRFLKGLKEVIWDGKGIRGMV